MEENIAQILISIVITISEMTYTILTQMFTIFQVFSKQFKYYIFNNISNLLDNS